MEVSFFGSQQTVLHKPLVTTRGAAQSVFRPCVNSAETLYNNTMYVNSGATLYNNILCEQCTNPL